jgi:cell division septation protein DedD
LQVAAVGRDEAEAIADVLQRKHFRAHAVPKPGSARLFRVLIGPVRDAADLSSTRDALRKTGFGEVIVQKY